MILALAASCGGDETTTTKKPPVTKPNTTTSSPVTTQEPTDTTGPASTDDPANTEDPEDTTEEPATTTAPAETQPEIEYPAQLEGIKALVEDSTVTFLYVEGGSGTYTADSIWIDTTREDLDAVDEQIIERNNHVYEDLGVTIEAITNPTLGIADLKIEAKTYFDIQSDILDVYAGYQYYDLGMATTGNICNLNTIVNENNETIIDFKQPYWATKYINAITYNDNLFWVTGDLSLRYTGGLYCTFVNLDLYETYVKSAYEDKSIYEIVEEKKWTLQTMLDMVDMVYWDDDGDGVASVGDRLGIVYETEDGFDGISIGCKVQYTKRSTIAGKDDIQINLHQDAKASKLAGLLYKMRTGRYAYNAGANDSRNMMPIFRDGKTLFAVNKIYQASVYLSEMERFAIIPTPLLDENQKEYAAACHGGLTIFGISKYSNCPIAAAATLELMAYYGSQLVTPTYVNSVLKGSETIRDERSLKMIDTIRAGFDTDFAAAWSFQIGEIFHIYRDQGALQNFGSSIKIKAARTWPTALKKLLADLDAVAAEQN